MLTYEIKKNKSFFNFNPIRPWNQQRSDTSYHPPQQAPFMGTADPEKRQAIPLLNNKQAYTEFVETIKKRWKVGDLVTMRVFPIILNRNTAIAHFIINDFEEIRDLAQWDDRWNEPKCVAIRAGKNQPAMFQMVCPSALRPLSQEERLLVDLLYLQEQNDVGTPS